MKEMMAPERRHGDQPAHEQQHRGHRELAVGVLVHEVGDHVVRLAVDLLLARLVEVELDELQVGQRGTGGPGEHG